MNNPDAARVSRLFAGIVLFCMLLAVATLALAVSLSLWVDAAAATQAAAGESINRETFTGAAIGRLWQAFSALLGALLGLLAGKTL